MICRYQVARDGKSFGTPRLQRDFTSEAAASASYARGPTGGDAYPYRYLGSPSRQRPKLGHTSPLGRATFLSLLYAIVVLLTISITFEKNDGGPSFSLQSGVRAFGYALAALPVLFAIGQGTLRVNRSIITWALVPILISATALYAADPLFSFTAGLAHLALLLFAWRMVTRHGPTPAVIALMAVGAIICALSIVVTFAFPLVGRTALVPLSAEAANRMRGVTDQPNSLGSISGVTILVATMHFRAFTHWQRVIAAAAIGLAGVCLAFSDSRTAMLAVVVCICMWWLCRANAALNLFTLVGIALAACLVVAYVPDLTPYLTRADSGSNDLATFNGRWYIWQVAWENIKAHPLIGQGYGSSRLTLPIDDRLFAAAVDAHNVWLELLFSGGALLFGLYLVGMTATLIVSSTRRRVEALVMLLFFLIVGSATSAPFGGLPLFQAAAFYTAISLSFARSGAVLDPRGRRLRPAAAARRDLISPGPYVAVGRTL